MPLQGDAEDILETYWETLNEDNRVSLAVRTINLQTLESKTLIKNRFSKVA
jgi:IMP cyclohydrolase